MITQERLKELLHYDETTGVFTWIVKPSYRVNAGAIAGSIDNKGYRTIMICRKMYKAHRLAWLYIHGELPANYIDHINGIKSDNRIENLRECNSKQNQQNFRRPNVDSVSGYLGVSFFNKGKKWRARIVNNNKVIHIGYFNTPEDAHQAYLDKKRELHEFCTI